MKRSNRFFQVTPHLTVSGYQEIIKVELIAGYGESNSALGRHSTDLILPILPIVTKTTNAVPNALPYLLLNESDSRLTEALCALNSGSTIEVFVIDDSEKAPHDLLRFLLGHVHPQLLSDVKPTDFLEKLREDPVSQKWLVEYYQLEPKRKLKNKEIISFKYLHKLLGSCGPSLNTITKYLSHHEEPPISEDSNYEDKEPQDLDQDAVAKPLVRNDSSSISPDQQNISNDKPATASAQPDSVPSLPTHIKPDESIDTQTHEACNAKWIFDAELGSFLEVLDRVSKIPAVDKNGVTASTRLIKALIAAKTPEDITTLQNSIKGFLKEKETTSSD